MKELVLNNNGKLVTSSRLVAEKFGKLHKNVIQSIEKLECSEEFNRLNFQPVEYLDSKGEKRPEYIITRDGFSFLVMGFTGKDAAKFKEEFISAFNKMEQVIKNIEKPSEDQLLLQAMNILNKRIEVQTEQLQLANQTIKQQAPKVKYVDNVLQSGSLISITTIAKDLGMSGETLNKKLCDMKVQYRQNGVYVLYSQYQNKGYTKTKTYPYTDSHGIQQTSRSMYWTEKGRAFIVHKLND